ncbi:MAG: 12-oxophytodienoate reductase [Leucobacter sp.]
MQNDAASTATALETDPLFVPVRVNSTVISNRFVLPAMQRGTRRYRPSAKMVENMRSAAAGGPGLIIFEGAAPDHPAGYWQPVFGILGQDTTEDWREVVQAVANAGDAVVLMQLWHPGALRLVVEGVPNPYPEQPALSPSGLVQEGRPNGVAMTRQDLEDTKAAYVQSALIAQQLGAKGIELHCAHGYLLDLFFWHETNRRTDEYGGATLADRARFPAEIVAAIREAAGPEFIISVRFSQWKEVDYLARIAQHPDELRPFLARLEEAGADLFHVSTRRFDTPAWPELDPERSLAAWVKTMTDRPVIAVGSVGLSKDMARDIFDDEAPQLQVEEDLDRVRQGLLSGDFDLIAVGRTQIANTDFVNRVRERDLSRFEAFRKEVHLDESDGGYAPDGQLVHTERKTD